MGKPLSAIVPCNLRTLQRRQAVLEEELRQPATDGDHERSCEEAELRAVMLAIQRIQEKTYGRCTECTGPISVSRLQALPHAERCIACQREHERRGVFGVLPEGFASDLERWEQG